MRDSARARSLDRSSPDESHADANLLPGSHRDQLGLTDFGWGLNVKYKDEDGKNKYVYMRNGTAIACSRGLIAVIENFQQADGSIRIPPL